MDESQTGMMTEEQSHKRMAIDLFNRTWDLLDKTERTPEENDKLVHAGHASRFHWGKAGKPVNLARGGQQLSHIYAVLKRTEPALFHGQLALEICRASGIADFDVAFAYEAGPGERGRRQPAGTGPLCRARPRGGRRHRERGRPKALPQPARDSLGRAVHSVPATRRAPTADLQPTTEISRTCGKGTANLYVMLPV